MIKLNLGCGGNGLEGFINLDKDPQLSENKKGWLFQDGFPEYKDGSVDAVTISHALMHLPPEDFKTFIKELYRVVKPNGVVRITEGNTEHPDSLVYPNGWGSGQACKTGPKMMRQALEEVGFKVYDVDKETTHYEDTTLIQSRHELEPTCFFMEGVK